MKVCWDLHVHTNLSRCGSREASVENCLEAAKKQELKKIGFSNHCWAKEIPGAFPFYIEQNIEHVLKIKEMLPINTSGKTPGETSGITQGITILVGCETEYIGNGIAGLNKELAEEYFDFVWIPANHFHQKGLIVPHDLGDRGPKEVSELLYRRFMEVTELGFGSGVVHPFIPLGFLEWETDILEGISDSQYINFFSAAASANLAIEINAYTAKCQTSVNENGFSNLYLKIHTIAKECGCKFFFGSDAHQPGNMSGYENMAKFAEACGIDETKLISILD